MACAQIRLTIAGSGHCQRPVIRGPGGGKLDIKGILVAGLVLLYAAAGILSSWFGYWYFQAFVFGSPLVATVAAISMQERWPVVHPLLSMFYFFPAILVVLKFSTSWIQTGAPLAILDWGQWLGWSALAALIISSLLVLAFRAHIDREWAVVGTTVFVLIYSVWTLGVFNQNLAQPSIRERATVVSVNPGLVRVRAWSVTIAPIGPFTANSEHLASPETFRAADDGFPVCLFTYSGAFGWRWTVLARCPA